MEAIFDFGVIKLAYIRSEDLSNGFVSFVYRDEFNKAIPNDNIRIAKLVCNYPPKVELNTECIIIKENKETQSNYCIAILDKKNKFKLNNDSHQSSSIYSSPNNTSRISCNTGNISLVVGDTKQAIDTNSFTVNSKNTKLFLGEEVWSLTNTKDNNVLSGITGGTKKMLLYDNNLIEINSQSILISLNNGNFSLVGRKSDESLDIENYQAINQFYVHANKFSMISGGNYNVSAGRVKFDVSSSLIASNTPGTGPDEAFHVNVVQGDIVHEVGLGDIRLQNYNFKFIDNVELRCGSLLHPTASGLKLEAFKTSYYLNTVYSGINSYLDFTTSGDAELYSFKNINIESKVGTMDLSSLQDMSLDTLMNMNLNSIMNMTLDAKMKMELNSLLAMDLKSALVMTLDALMVNINSKVGVIIKAGATPPEPSVLGAKLVSWLASHIHPTGVGPSGPPITAGALATILSPLVKNN